VHTSRGVHVMSSEVNRSFAAFFLALTLSGQTPAFEATSVKPTAPGGRGGRTTTSGDRITFANTTLLNALARAYTVRGFQIDGPSWIRTDRYANPPAPSPCTRRPARA
jgi:hypothetical protein